MPRQITITIAGVKLQAELNDSKTSDALRALLPLEFSMSRWGDEYYGGCGISVKQAPEAKEVMGVGELAVWPVGRLIDNPEPLRKLGSSVTVRVEEVK